MGKKKSGKAVSAEELTAMRTELAELLSARSTSTTAVCVDVDSLMSDDVQLLLKQFRAAAVKEQRLGVKSSSSPRGINKVLEESVAEAQEAENWSLKPVSRLPDDCWITIMSFCTLESLTTLSVSSNLLRVLADSSCLFQQYFLRMANINSYLTPSCVPSLATLNTTGSLLTVGVFDPQEESTMQRALWSKVPRKLNDALISSALRRVVLRVEEDVSTVKKHVPRQIGATHAKAKAPFVDVELDEATCDSESITADLLASRCNEKGLDVRWASSEWRDMSDQYILDELSQHMSLMEVPWSGFWSFQKGVVKNLADKWAATKLLNATNVNRSTANDWQALAVDVMKYVTYPDGKRSAVHRAQWQIDKYDELLKKEGPECEFCVKHGEDVRFSREQIADKQKQRREFMAQSVREREHFEEVEKQIDVEIQRLKRLDAWCTLRSYVDLFFSVSATESALVHDWARMQANLLAGNYKISRALAQHFPFPKVSRQTAAFYGIPLSKEEYILNIEKLATQQLQKKAASDERDVCQPY